MAIQFLIKETMHLMKTLSCGEIALSQDGINAGIKLIAWLLSKEAHLQQLITF